MEILITEHKSVLNDKIIIIGDHGYRSNNEIDPYNTFGGFYGFQKEDLDEAKFTPAQVSALKDKYGKLGSGAEKNAVQMDKLAKMMSKYSKSHLSQLADMGVPMVSKVAKELMK